MRWNPLAPAEPVVTPDVIAASWSRGERTEGAGTRQRVPRPVFVLGSLRSGASLLTLSLGQHPNLLQVLETNWFERFGIGLQQAFGDGHLVRNRSQLPIDGIEIEDFFAHFGDAIDRLMLRSVDTTDDVPGDDPTAAPYRPGRWLDGTPRNCFAVFVLTRLFPAARFIHIVRDVNEVVTALSSDDTRRHYRSRYLGLTPKEAYQHWLDATRACLDAERAFGSSVVMRVRRDDLVAAPEQTLRRCLDFLGEPFAPECLRAFSSVGPTSTPRLTGVETATGRSNVRKIRDEAEALNYLIFAETPSVATPPAGGAVAVDYPEDLVRIAALEAAFSDRCKRGQSGVPSSLPESGSRRVRSRGRASRLPAIPLRGIINRVPRAR
ncbi:MAG TPA: sulfotransferase [Thermomicrobiales bacterium]|nr:sulfotransferase [Thermomicrobiales bacterium]